MEVEEAAPALPAKAMFGESESIRPSIRGAEALIEFGDFFGKKTITKTRLAKPYRHPDLDKLLTRRRMAAEIRCLRRCRSIGIDTPLIYFVDKKNHKIVMEAIDGDTVKNFLCTNPKPADAKKVVTSMGMVLARMHDASITHGDLTTSNFMLRKMKDAPPSLVIIDFGLGALRASAEDKAVDLYVLERAFISTHPDSEPLFAQVLKMYAATSTEWAATSKRLERVRQRGRKRLAFG